MSAEFDLVGKAVAGGGIDARMRKIEQREWWLWAAAIVVTLLLTGGIVSFVVPMLHMEHGKLNALDLDTTIRGLVAVVLLFDLYIIFQQLQIYRMRKRLREREQVFQLITENAADMIAVVDPHGQWLYNSPAYEKVLGYTAEELRSTNSFEQIHPDDRPLVQQAAQEVLEGGAGRRIEYRISHKDGSVRFLESTSSAVLNAQGKVDKLVMVNRDISGRRQLEEQFLQAQKMEAVGRLSGGVAHDFNNLLGVIIGYAEVLQEKLEAAHPLRGSVDEIAKAGQRAAALTRQLLAFSRLQVLDPKVLDLNSVVSDLEKMLRRLIPENIELTTALGADLGRVKADEGQIEQIIMNLVVNARDAMPNGGSLTIRTSNSKLDQSYAMNRAYPVQQGDYVCLTVTDTGIGMDTATQARIFEPFFTTKEKGQGTGLGLSTVYGVVKQSGGYIDVFSKPGRGTTFNIHLPRVHEAVGAEKPQVRPSGVLTGHETVLLVEDEDSLRTLTRNLLRMSGYDVLEARDGMEATRLATQFSEPIHLLLTDVVMPKISGRELAEELTRIRPGMKVLYMSGYTGQHFTGRGRLEDGSQFLQKPFSRDVLARKVREVLGERAAVGH
jgi:two-component system, cell cycle sensor histidine kinase and response regulator CckA